jgi:D-alanine--poly(phosphoribitol) ligase subunit 1
MEGLPQMPNRPHNLGLAFQAVSGSAPTALALVCRGETYDFQSLNSLANRFARWLISRGATRGAVVCLELPKIAEAYALALASLKIGAPYAFLDSTAPVDRARRMIERCNPAVVVSVRGDDADRVVLGDAAQCEALHRELAAFDHQNLAQTGQITGADPAYVMFTSGSTGEPKGAVLPHEGVLNLVEWAGQDLGIGRGDRLTNVNPLYFDNSVFDLYCGFLNGAAVVALDAFAGRPPGELVDTISEHGCTFFFAVPTLFMHLDAMRLLTPDRLPSVKRFMFAGEGFPVARLRRFYEAFAGKASLINSYGPTETSCLCSRFDVTAAALETTEGLLPLGRLNPNFSHRILDDELRPVAAGETGELWLGGPCVALGYLNNPEESNRRFQQDPLISGYRAVLYRSGDLVQEDAQTGILKFRGRADNQIKLRGYRIELEEIDHALVSIPGVTAALAALIPGSGEFASIAAAYSGAKLLEAELLAYCRSRLPGYMIPGRFLWVDALPTNPNGKADRRAVAKLLA